jgi:hypothetical protein
VDQVVDFVIGSEWLDPEWDDQSQRQILLTLDQIKEVIRGWVAIHYVDASEPERG